MSRKTKLCQSNKKKRKSYFWSNQFSIWHVFSNHQHLEKQNKRKRGHSNISLSSLLLPRPLTFFCHLKSLEIKYSFYQILFYPSICFILFYLDNSAYFSWPFWLENNSSFNMIKYSRETKANDICIKKCSIISDIFILRE